MYKLRALKFLKRIHEARGDKILIFCTRSHPLIFFAEKLGIPAIHGEVKTKEREFWFDCFRKNEIHTLILSTVSDEAIDLPTANVGI